METNSQFDILAGELNDEEKRRMLAAIRTAMESEAAPIAPDPEPEAPSLEVQLRSLLFWDRIKLFFAQIFSGRSKEDVLQGWMVRGINEKLQKARIDGIDARTGQFREAFATSLEELKSAADTLSKPVEIVPRRRTELVLALSLNFFPGIHQELIRVTGETHIRGMKEPSERFLKRQLTNTLEQKLGEIPGSARTEMKNALCQGDTLYRLATYGFGAMLSSFEGSGMETGRHCAFEYVLRNVEQLTNILAGFGGPVDLALLETLVILDLDSEEARNDESVFQEAIRRGLGEMTKAIGAFRDFATTYPLQLIIQSVKEDPWWKPHVEESGEDWISLYKNFFSERMHKMILRVSLENQIAKQLETLREIAEEEPKGLAGLPDGKEKLQSKIWYQALAMKTLSGKIVRNVLPHLKIVLTTGEFYKSSNRAQYNDAYSEFERVRDKVVELEKNLAPDGIWGSVVWSDSVTAQRKQMLERIDHEVGRAVELAQTTVEMLVNVLGGILYARPGSSYDTLANYGQIGGRRNAELIDDLKDVHATLQTFMNVMGEFGALEKRAGENEIVLDTEILDRRKESRPS